MNIVFYLSLSDKLNSSDQIYKTSWYLPFSVISTTLKISWHSINSTCNYLERYKIYDYHDFEIILLENTEQKTYKNVNTNIRRTRLKWLCFPLPVFFKFVIYSYYLYISKNITDAYHPGSHMPGNIQGKIRRNILPGPWFSGVSQL